MSEKKGQIKKRNWIKRVVNIFQDLELNTIYTPPSMRQHLKNNYDDSISLSTTRKLLKNIIKAQEAGLQFVVNNKVRKLVLKDAMTRNQLYELIEL